MTDEPKADWGSFLLAGCLMIFIIVCAAGAGAFLTWAVMMLSGSG